MSKTGQTLGSIDSTEELQGLLNLDKPVGVTSFDVVARVRRHTKVKRVGHAGTLDPFASGVLLILVGRTYTRLSDQLMQGSKKYQAHAHLGRATDTHDHTGQTIARSECIPSFAQVQIALAEFCGQILQVPPMFSAKKVGGQRLYELARQGIEREREPASVYMQVRILHYDYPDLTLEVLSGKGAYMRSLAHELGKNLKCWAHLKKLVRQECGPYSLDKSLDGRLLFGSQPIDLKPHLQRVESKELS